MRTGMALAAAAMVAAGLAAGLVAAVSGAASTAALSELELSQPARPRPTPRIKGRILKIRMSSLSP